MDLADLLGTPAGSTPDPALQALADGVRLTWDAETFTALVDDDEPYSGSREEATTSGGMLGRMPAEPAGLVEMLRHAEDVAPAGSGDSPPGGRTHVSARVPSPRHHPPGSA